MKAKILYFFSTVFMCGYINVLMAKPLVVTSFTILKDWITVLAGDEVEVYSIVGPNQDAHIFEPTPHTLKMLLKADLIVVYGFGFEGWFDRLMQTLPSSKNIIYLTQGQKALHYFDQTNHTYIKDPHAWHDLTYAMENCRVLAKALQSLLPQKAEAIEHRLQTYLHKLKDLDMKIKTMFKALLPHQKVVVTSHDGFGYYAAAYGIKFFSLMGLSTESQPSARIFADLVGTIQKHGVTRLFLENITNPQLINQLAEETHTHVDGPLYSDALSEETEPASTFLALMIHNSTLFYKSMKEMVAHSTQ